MWQSLLMRYLPLLLVLAAGCCYVEWANESATLFQMEWIILRSLGSAAYNFLHPVVLMPMVGQLLLLVSMLRVRPLRALVLTGIAMLGILVLLVLLAGIMGRQLLMILSCLPFIGLAILYVRIASAAKS